jgi:transcription elongation GreA/GreB family factor
MAISRTIQGALLKGDFDTIEDEWLNRLGEGPEDLDYFVGVARALSGQGEGERARALLDLLDDQLRQRKRWPIRLKLLERAGHLLLTSEKLHAAILDTLKALYGNHSSYKMLVDKAGLLRAPQNIAKTWEKVERFRNLMTFDVDSVVFMEGKGAGRIQEINLPLDSFKIDFEQHRGLMVGFRAAAKLLEPIGEDHILYRKLDDLEALRRLAEDDPAELLRLTLTSYPGPRSGAEIRSDLAGIVDEKRWTSWWATARKHQQVLTAAKGRQTYRWAESTEDASDAVWASFLSHSDPAVKIDLFRRNAPRDESLRQGMTEALVELGKDSSPSLAFEIWFALEKAGSLPEDLPWSPAGLLRDSDNVAGLLAEVQDRALRDRAYSLLREVRADWPTIYQDLLDQETETRLLGQLADSLEAVAPEAFQSFVERTVSQPRKQPAAFVWLAERAADDESLLQRSPLRFLKQILVCLQDEVFAPFRAARLVPLAESGGTLPRLLNYLDEDSAEQAGEAIFRAAGLEGYQRDGLRTALELRFASLRKEEEAPLYALPASIEAKRAEFQRLKTIEIPENRKAIEEARAMGDLRENFEYKSARQRHEYLNSRVASLNHELSRVQPIDLTKVETTDARIGTRLRLSSNGGEPQNLTILGPWESKPEEDIISYESEIAQNLLGKRVGDAVRLSGKEYRIEEIFPYSGS